MVILPVDQGFEHGPYRSFGMNPDTLDPDYHFRLAIESGCAAMRRRSAFWKQVPASLRGKFRSFSS